MDDVNRAALRAFMRGRVFGPVPLALLDADEAEAVSKAERAAEAKAPPYLDTARALRRKEAREIAGQVRKAEGGRIPLLDAADRRHRETEEIARKAELRLNFTGRGIDFGFGDTLPPEFDEEIAVSAGGRADRPIDADARSFTRNLNPLGFHEARSEAAAREPRRELQVGESEASDSIRRMRAELAELRRQLGTAQAEKRERIMVRKDESEMTLAEVKRLTGIRDDATAEAMRERIIAKAQVQKQHVDLNRQGKRRPDKRKKRKRREPDRSGPPLLDTAVAPLGE